MSSVSDPVSRYYAIGLGFLVWPRGLVSILAYDKLSSSFVALMVNVS